MKAYVVALYEVPESLEIAHRCVQSGLKYGIDVHIHPGVWKTRSEEVMQKEGLFLGEYNQSYANTNAVIGNFMSQYQLWQQVEEPTIILEHDAVFIKELPDNISFEVLLNIGHPSFGKYKKKDAPGIYPLFSKHFLPGAHAYIINKRGARQAIELAKMNGIIPVDVFFSKGRYKGIQELYPWVVKVDESFSTIQKEKGCTAKHQEVHPLL